jgi:hypothetical protein
LIQPCSEAPSNPPEEYCCEHFHHQVTRRDRTSAIGASRPQDQPRQDRDVPPPWNPLPAPGTKRATRLPYGQTPWQPINAHIQKRSNHSAKQRGQADPEREWDHKMHRLDSTTPSAHRSTSENTIQACPRERVGPF